MVQHPAGRLVARRQPARIGSAADRVGLRAVDQVPPVDREFDAVAELGGAGAGLGELAGDPADPEHRAVGGELQPPGQQVEQRGLAGGVPGGALLRVLGAVAGLEDVRLPPRDPAEQGPQPVHVGGRDQRRAVGQLLLRGGEFERIGPVRLLPGGAVGELSQEQVVH